MSELKNISVSNGSGRNESFVEVEEIEEESIETFREVFGESESSFHNASLNNIVEKVEINEVIKEIQQEIKNKEHRLERTFTMGDPTLTLLLLSGFSIASVVLANHFLYYLNFSENIEGFILIASFAILPLSFFGSLPKRLKKKKALSNDITHLYREMLQTKLQGTIIGDPVLNDQWNLVKVQQNNKIVEYVVRIIVDENDNESFEIRELK